MSIFLNAVSVCEYFHNRTEATHLQQRIQIVEARIKKIKESHSQQIKNDPHYAMLQAKSNDMFNAVELADAQIKATNIEWDQLMKTFGESKPEEFDVLNAKRIELTKKIDVCLDNVTKANENIFPPIKEIEKYHEEKGKVLWSELGPLDNELQGYVNSLEAIQQKIESANRCAKRVATAGLVAFSAAAACYLGSWQS